MVFEIGRGTDFKSEHVGMGAQGNNIGHISKGGEVVLTRPLRRSQGPWISILKGRDPSN